MPAENVRAPRGGSDRGENRDRRNSRKPFVKEEKLFEEKVVSAGNGILSTIDLSKQAAQLLILTVTNSKNEIVTTQKLVKK